ncbi:MAG: hypothetical protein KDE51_19270, partial [Anaerolineales bacterium]|nr:hypothetical protein [Anaerolineales bacterium]
MQKKLFFLIPIVLVVLAILVPTASMANRSANAPIRMQSTVFVPTQGETPNIAQDLSLASYAAGQRGYYIVQFDGPVRQEWKDAVAAAGGELLGYIPDYAFKVRMNPAEASSVENLSSVAWVGVYQPAFKLSADLKLDGINLYTVRAERGVNFGLTRAAVAQTGAEMLGYEGDIMVIGADAEQISAIAQVTDVAWIENFKLAQKHNDSGAGVIIGGNAANTNGYDGSTQIAAVADTGLGDGTAAGAHRDIQANRIVSINNWPGVTDQCFQTIYDDGAIDVDSAHGTHVAGSVLSSGDPQTGLGRGTAPAAGLVFQATENYVRVSNFCQLFGGYPAYAYFLTGLPADLNDLYQQA